jgi:hypothetical protein
LQIDDVTANPRKIKGLFNDNTASKRFAAAKFDGQRFLLHTSIRLPEGV